MSSPLQICAATLLAVCLGCAVYLAPSQSPLRSEAPGDPSTPLASSPTVQTPLWPLQPSAPSLMAGGIDGVGPPAVTREPDGSERAASPRAGDGVGARTFPEVSHPTPEPATDAPVRTGSFPPPASRAIVHEASGQQWIIPYGAALPAPLIEPGSDATSAQIDAMDEIADAFVKDLATAQAEENESASKPKSISPRTTWDAATRQANERYRLLFGVEAYNARTAAAAKEALAERR